MNMNFGEFKAAKMAAPVDYAMLCASLSVAQATSPTARFATIGNDRGLSRPKSHTEHAIILFRNEQGWQSSPSAMRGSFHAAAASQFAEASL